MGYALHITRKQEWFGEGPDISFDEWISAVDADPDMRLDGYAEARLPDGSVVRTESEGLAVWAGYSRHDENVGMAWFRYWNGSVTVKNPDDEIIGKMCALATILGAHVQGDEGES